MIAMEDIQVKKETQTSSTDFNITTVESVSYTIVQKSATVPCSG